MKKKILQVVAGLDIGGLETVAMNIVRNSDAQIYEFDFLVYTNKIGDYEAEARNLGCNIIHIKRTSNPFTLFKRVKNVIELNGKYDIVHSHTYFNSGIVILAARFCNIQERIAHAHSIKRKKDNQIVKRFFYSIMRWIMQLHCTKCVACSVQAGQYVFGKTTFCKKGLVFPNLIDMNIYKYNTISREKMRRKLSISSDTFVLGNVGHLTAVKNQYFLLCVLSVLLKKIPNTILVIVGDGELKDQLYQAAVNLDIQDNVIFTGKCTNVNELLSTFDVFLLPSLHEGFGITAIEAIANGLSCICERNAIVTELKELENCIVLDGFDPEVWCDKIINSRATRKHQIPSDVLKFDSKKYPNLINELYGK